MILGYVLLYWRGLNAAGRYEHGFVLERCPACRTGHLSLRERTERILGIPQVRRTVRCDTCQSLLREVGTRRWRYTVDRSANPTLYERLNGYTLGDDALRELEPRPSQTPED